MGHTYSNILIHVVFSTKNRRQTFEEEFVAFLDRHEVEYDPRYVWD